jgi:type I restriction enzyme M protein
MSKQNNTDLNREELHKKIWSLANKLRGSIDGWDFKSYVLGFMFYKFLSDKFYNEVEKYEEKSGRPILSLYKSANTEPEITKIMKEINYGYFVKDSNRFDNVLDKSRKNPEKTNEYIKEAFEQIESSTNITHTNKSNQAKQALKGLFSDIRTDSNQLGSDQKTRNERLIVIMEELEDWYQYSSDQIDVIGDAYEYLMAMYASSAGKSGGEYFTPQEVSELLTLLAINDRKNIYGDIYDPACGSGSLLLRSVKKLGEHKIGRIYGQEYNATTYNLCRINMLLHGLEPSKFSIGNADTLKYPEKAFIDVKKPDIQVIVSNPPYSIKWDGSDIPNIQSDERFRVTALAPKSKADFAFILHSLHYLADTGIASIVCFPGIMYRGGAEQKIRDYLVSNNKIHTIIQLPANLFFGTSISTYIMVLVQKKDDEKVLFIDASSEFIKETNNNKLSNDNINNIYKLYKDRKDVEYKAKLVSKEDIEENNYDLSVSKYVIAEDKTEKVDIKVLNNQIKEIVAKEDKLRKQIDEIIKSIGDISE